MTRAWNFVLRKLDFDTIYHAYLNESPFKYYISTLGGRGWGSEGNAYFAYVVRGRWWSRVKMLIMLI